MKIPQYVTVEEVRRVCKELKITDWTKKKEPKVSLKEAKIILAEVKGKSLAKKGLLSDDEFLGIVREVLPGRVG